MASVHDGPATVYAPHVPCPQPAPDKAKLLHLAGQWRDLIAANGRTPKHIAERHLEVCRLLEAARYELSDAPVQIALGKLRAGGASLRTCNKHLSSIKSFARWLARPSARVIPFDPLAEIRAFNVKKDRRVERTSFLPVLGKLLETAEKSARAYRGVGGPDRAELYHAAACTGLREGTLAVVEAGQFHLSPAAGGVAYVKVRADQVKDGEDLVVPIQPDSAARLRAYLASKLPTARAFRTPPHDYDFARMLRADLKEAKISPFRAVDVPAGRKRRVDVLDFHALRHTFGSWCAGAGIELTVTQKWMGHSDPALTANVYTHVVPADQAAAVGKLPPLPGVKRAS